MGYSIHYGPAPKIAKRRQKIHFGPPIIAFLLAISIISARYIWPEETMALREALFPWTRKPVQEAFSHFIKDLDAGDSFRDAAAAFCLEVLNSGQ